MDAADENVAHNPMMVWLGMSENDGLVDQIKQRSLLVALPVAASLDGVLIDKQFVGAHDARHVRLTGHMSGLFMCVHCRDTHYGADA